MYLICINDKNDESGSADYRQGIIKGRVYYVPDAAVSDNWATGKEWHWDLNRFKEVSKVEVIIALGRVQEILELP